MIHRYKTKEANIVIDTYSGSIHLVDDLVYQALGRMNQKDFDLENPKDWERLEHTLLEGASQSDVQEAISEIHSLIDAGSLFSDDPYKDLAGALCNRPTFVKALCLNVAHTCNLDCDYCFASQGKYHGDRALMSWDVAKQSVDFLIRASGHHKNLDIDFFGGEPSLNWDVVKKTVAYARSMEKKHNKHFRFTFTTNGMLLTPEMGEYLNQEMHNVVLSLDGRPSVHDRLRHTIDGKGSYDRVLPRFQQFVESRGDKEYYMRGTYTKNNIDFTEDVFHMANLGFSRLSMEPVIGNPEEPYMLNESDLPELKRQYDILADEMIRRNRLLSELESQGGTISDLAVEDRPFLFYHFMINLSEGPCIHKRISGCGSGTEYMAVTPWGELYPCHQFIGDKGYAVGTVQDGISAETLIREFKQCNCYAHPECEECWAKLYCSGGCAANALHAAGSITGVVDFSCELFRKRMECAIRIQAAQAVATEQRSPS